MVVSLLIALFWILFNKQLMGRHSHVVVTAYGVAAWDGDADGLGAAAVWDAAGGWGVGEGMARVGGERGVVYSDDYAALELGDDPGSGFAGGSAVEYGAADWESAGRAGVGGAAGAERLGWRRIDSGFGDYVDDAIEDEGARRICVDLAG